MLEDLDLFNPNSEKCQECEHALLCAILTKEILKAVLLDEIRGLMEDTEPEREPINIPPCPECGSEVTQVDIDLFRCSQCDWNIDLSKHEPTEVHLTPFGVIEVYDREYVDGHPDDKQHDVGVYPNPFSEEYVE